MVSLPFKIPTSSNLPAASWNICDNRVGRLTAESSSNSLVTLINPPDFSILKGTWPTVGVWSLNAASSAIAPHVADSSVGIYPSLLATRTTVDAALKAPDGSPVSCIVVGINSSGTKYPPSASVIIHET